MKTRVVNAKNEFEAARWLSECVADMHAKLNLTPGQVIIILINEAKRQTGEVLMEEGADT